LGKTSLPVSLQELLYDQADSQWIEVEGVVHSVAEDEDGEHLWINLATGLWRLKAYVPGVRPAQAAQLVDAKVRVRGAGGSIHNQKRQLIGLQLYVPNAQQVVVEEPAAPDPFSLPLRPCNSLLRFRPQGIEVHRVRVHGAVTLQHAGRSLYIRDKTDGLYVVTAQTTPVQLGDEVDVAGFPALGEYAPVLEDAIFRRTASGPLPLPVEVTAEAARGGNYDAELVRIEGRLVESEIRGAYESLLIQVGNVFFNADLLMDQARGRLMALQRGSRLRLTAVCSIKVDANRVPQGFRLYLRSPEDVVVLEHPPWWTIWHTFGSLGLMASFILAALAWAAALRRQVREHTSLIREFLRRETALRKQYHDLFENAHEVVYTVDLKGNITSVNKAGEQISGYTRAEAVGMNVLQFLGREQAASAQEDLARLAAGEELKAAEWEIMAKDGRRVALEISSRLIYREGKPVGVQSFGRDITARKQAEEALAKEHDLLRTLIGNLPDYIFVKDTESRFLLNNPAHLRALGVRTQEETLGKTDFDFFPQELAARYCADEQAVVRAGQPLIDREQPRIDRRGNKSWVSTTKVPWRDANGKVVGLVGISRDITERRQAEKRLEERTAYLNALIENSPLAIVAHDPQGRVEMCNPAFEHLFQYRQEEILGANIDELVAPGELHAEGSENTWRVLAGEVHHSTARRRRKDGTLVDVELHGVPLRVNGELVGAYGLYQDITKRQQAEAALQESQERTRTIIETAYDAFIAVDSNGSITDWNTQAETTFGWSRSEVAGRRLSDTIMPPQLREAYERSLKHFLATGEGPALNQRIEITALHRDGHEFPVELTVSPIRWGDTYFFSAFVHDISDRKRAEAELQSAKEAAEAASRAKSEFLANMSHEIRTPLNGIMGMAELALDTDLTPEQHEYLNLVRISGESLLTVVNDILDFSKIEAGRLDLDRIEFSLAGNLSETLKPLAWRAHQRGLELVFQVAPEAPAIVVGDPTRPRQIIINLVGNAIKFTERGEVALSLARVFRTAQEALLHFTVRDTGIGIPAEKHKLIFDAFAQADSSTTRKYGGTGLGLAISARLVEIMGGRIWVESEEGKGSTFHFTVRVGLPQGPLPEHSLAEPADLQDAPALIVDDNATNRRILVEMLLTWQMKPLAVESGEAALEAVERARQAGRPFALYLIDSQMPGMDGFTLAERIRENAGATGATIMMLTSAGQRGDAARCRALGITAYLIKPVYRPDVREAILVARGTALKPTLPTPLITRHSLREARRG